MLAIQSVNLLEMRCQKPKPKKKVTGNTHGLDPKWHRPQVREFVDQDYLDQLSPEEKLWLARFNDEFYGGAFRANPLHTDPEQRREIWRDLRRGRTDGPNRGGDALTVSRAAGALDSLDDGDRDIHRTEDGAYHLSSRDEDEE